MSNELVPISSGLTLSNKTPYAPSGKQLGYGGPALKADFQHSNLLSGMTVAAFGDQTKQVEKYVSNLRSPLSPASLPFVSIEKGSIENQLFDATASIKILTSQVAMHMDREWRDKLFSQIDLLHDLDEWDADDRPLKKASFATFLKLILQIRPQRYPGLGLSYEGNLIAAWTTGQDRLTTEYFPYDRVRWVLTCNLNGEVERATGETVVSRLYKCLMPYHPDHWFLYEKD